MIGTPIGIGDPDSTIGVLVGRPESAIVPATMVCGVTVRLAGTNFVVTGTVATEVEVTVNAPIPKNPGFVLTCVLVVRP